MNGSTILSEFVRKIRRALRLRGPLAEDPTAKVLHALVLGSSIWMGFNVGIILPFVTPAKVPAILVDLALLFTLIAARALLQRGSMREASLVYVGGMWVIATLVSTLSGGIHSPALLFYVALPISAAWLLGFRAALWSAAVSLGTSLAMAVLDLTALKLPIYFPGKPIGVLSDVLYATVIATVPAAQVLKILKEALAASQKDKEALRRERDVLARIMETSPVGILVVSREGKVTFANANAERVLGVTGEGGVQRAYGKRRGRFFDCDGHPLTDEALASTRVIRTGKPVHDLRYFFERPDGKRILLAANAAPILNPAGEVESVAVAVEDITERTRAEKELLKHQENLEELVEHRTAELVEARDQAQAANRAKSTFLAKMSHELRTPLSAILGFCGLMRNQRNLTEQQHADLQIINRSGEHLLDLIDDVLDVCKIEAGRILVDKTAFDLGNLVRSITEMLRGRAEGKNLRLLLDPWSEFPQFIRADASKLRQVLINLIGNAVKYTESGEIWVRVNTAATEQPQQLLLRLEVEDTGLGIAPADQERIFEPFMQGENATRHKGTGLGLAITRQVVQLLGGTITVKSTPGKGSLFRVEVPVQEGDESEAMGAATDCERVIGLASGQPAYRVLIVEDEAANGLLLQRLLEEAGFRVRLAENGLDGIEAFQSWRPHFIWMDRRMPVMDGMEATRRIRELDGGQDVKIACVSASVLAEERDDVMAAGFDDFIRKPYNASAIFNCMGRHLGVRYLFEQSYVTPGSGSPAPIEAICPQALIAIPEQLRGELEDALICLDIRRIEGLVRRILEIDGTAGGTLARHAETFAFTAILRALQASKREQVGETSWRTRSL